MGNNSITSETPKNAKKKIKIKKIKNKGTGAGGSKTNANGLPYENLTDLSTEYDDTKKYRNHSIIKFKQCENLFVSTNQSHLFKYMKDKIDTSIKHAHGCKRPDECYINEQDKKIFIIEKKFQQTGGSVCEKIQTTDFKKWQYKRLFPKYEIIYIFCLSNWFKTNCKAELEYLHFKNIPVFWGNSETYKTDMINFITNYK
tara:strand:+ start:710 stop:1309 length:600 start_codon:yes stop_codon:yes gene_type:complete